MRAKTQLVAAAMIVGASISLSVKQSWAHHAFGAEFDAELPVVLEGPITKIEWVNPHAWIHLEHTDEAGEKQQWMVEGGTPNTLLRRGLTKRTLELGTIIVVHGYQAKDRSTRANGRDITFEDGRKIFMGSSGTGAPEDWSDPEDEQ